jgi:hypothetical protein
MLQSWITSIKLTMTLTDLSGGTVNVETVLMTCSKQNTSYNVQNLVIKFYFKQCHGQFYPTTLYKDGSC